LARLLLNKETGNSQKLQQGFILNPCDEGNQAPGARTTIVVPLTTQGRAFVFYVPVPKGPVTGLDSVSWANCTQLFTVDKERLKTRLGVVPGTVLKEISRAVASTLGLWPTG
jgi:mRNA-degrading endonuclease toxin of MazEF toxin-antitoxin module